MKRTIFLIGVLLIAFVALSWCSSKKVTTSTNSDATAPINQQQPTLKEMWPVDLRPAPLYGTKSLSLVWRDVYLNDDWTRQVFFERTNSGENDAAGVMQWLIKPTQTENLTERLIKQATVSVWGNRLLIPQGAALKEHLLAHNITITTSWDDLILIGNRNEEPKTSYLLFTQTLPENYIINNMTDWFGAPVFMIPKNDYTLLSLTWWSQVQNITVWYATGEMTYQLWRWYEDRYAGKYVLSDDIVVPQETQLWIAPSNFSSEANAYFVEFAPWKRDENAIDLIKNTDAKEQLRTYSANRSLQVATLQRIESVPGTWWVFSTTDAVEQAVIIEEPTHSFLVPLHNYPFTVELQKEAGDEYRPYYSRFLSSYRLDQESVNKTLADFFGEKRFTYTDYGVRDAWFTYEIQPKVTYSGDLMIHSIFWQRVTVPAVYRVESLDKRVIEQNIVSNSTMSILPRSGIFQDVLIQYKNIEAFGVSMQWCEVMSNPNFVWAYQWRGAENYLFDCGWPIVEKTVTPNSSEEFAYRRVYRTPLPIPESLSGATAFKVFFKDQKGVEQSHYFMKSDVGIWSKTADNELWVWWFTLTDGKPLDEWTVSVKTVGWKNLWTAVVKEGKAVIRLPELWNTYDYENQRKDDTYLIELKTDTDRSFVLAQRSWRWDLAVPGAVTPGADYNERYLLINSRLQMSEVTQTNTQLQSWWSIDPIKIYGYTDRWLYKAWDMIYFAWRVKDIMRQSWADALSWKTVGVSLVAPSGGEPTLVDNLTLDAYGWFEWQIQLPNPVKLGDYIMEYRLNDAVVYSHNIKIEEYQKPTFFTDITPTRDKDVVGITLAPTYFFWAPLRAYDASVTWSLAWKNACRDCRRWNDEPYYYNYVFNDTLNTWWTVVLHNQTTPKATLSLFDQTLDTNNGYAYTLKVETIVKDLLSNETQFATKYIEFDPVATIWLAWQPYERRYRNGKDKDPREWTLIEWTLTKGKEKVKKLRYEVYRWSYDNQVLKPWVDGNYYYANGNQYIAVFSGDLAVLDKFAIPALWIDQPGDYLIRLIAEDVSGQLIGESQKRISRYSSEEDNENALLGAVPNTYTLTVDIPKKTYTEQEMIPINIVPYQSGAWVVVTVEKWQYILDSFVKQLDGRELSLPVKKLYAPQVIVNVMMLQGSESNNTKRKEPRFFAGYASATIDTWMNELAISVSSDKPTYQPGEQVTLTITTKDAAWKPVDARVSVAVVDQALDYLYRLIKEPMPYFFNKVWTSVFTYTNMKLLYQSLKAFATWGQKWWSWNWWKAMFSFIRDDLKDAAFWSGAIYTVDGKATVSFIAPDNITTWLVDVIGITKETQLWTITTWFSVKKDLVLEPNAPLYVTIWDKLTVPVKVIVPDSEASGTIRWSARLRNQFWEEIALWTYEVKPNTMIALDVAVPHERRQSQWVDLIVDGKYGTANDTVQNRLPLRTEWLVSKDSVGVLSKAGSHSFVIPESYTASLSIQLAQIPTNFIDPVLKYLVHYPYWCTEQILSSLLPLVASQQLRDQWVFTSDLISWSAVFLEHWPVAIETLVANWIAKLATHQRADGWFAYRPVLGDEQNTQVSPNIYMLSAYVYSALHIMQSVHPQQSQKIQSMMIRLEAFLNQYRTVDTLGVWWYLLTKVTNGQQLWEDEQSLLDAIPVNEWGYGPLIRYLVAVAQKDAEAAKKRKPLARIPTNDQERHHSNIFFNGTTFAALKLRWLLADSQATQEERSELILSLLKQRDKNGLWTWNTQSNVQVLQTLLVLASTRNPQEKSTCEVTIDGKKQTIIVDKTTPWHIEQPLITTWVVTDWSCSQAILADVTVSFMPKELSKTMGAASHVAWMQRSISHPKAAIGDKVNIIWSFTTDLAWEQVAVDMFVPSDYKLLATISQKDDASYFPFDVSDPHCLPTHRETRFDRLFLYYDVLEPWVCDITIPALKAYSGTTTIMPMRVHEMYKWLVNGRKVVEGQ